MGLFRKFFYRKPPDGLLEISEGVYVFDCCFSTNIWEDNEYKIYVGGIVGKLRDHLPDASFVVFNFREGQYQSLIAGILSEYDVTVMDYPRQCEGCSLLTMEMIHHFLRSGESWLSLGPQNVILMHCEQGGWPVLAFMLAALLIHRKQFTGEQRTLDMIYKQAPPELLWLMSPLNPLPSQLRYLQYISRRNRGSEWPLPDRLLALDCIILRFIPNMDCEGDCSPIYRIHGQDPFMASDRTPKVLLSTPKKSKQVWYYKQEDCEPVKIDIHCHVLGDVVLECISLDSDQERESMVFRAMFNTAFIRSNILILNSEEIDMLWNAKDQFPKDFRAEVILSEMDGSTSPGIEEKDGIPMEAFSKVQEILINVDWLSPKKNVANMVHHISLENIIQENLGTGSPKGRERATVLHDDKVKEKPKLQASEQIIKSPTSAALEKQLKFSFGPSLDANSTRKKFVPEQIQVASQKPAHATPSFGSSSDPSPIERKTELQEHQVTPMETEHSKNSIKPSPETNSIRRKVETQELQVALRQSAQSTLSFKPTLDVNSSRKKTEPQEPWVAIQRHAQPKIISQRAPQSSISAPVSYCNSLPGSSVPISRYHNAPSALGITALLHDHVESKGEEQIHPVTLPLSPSYVSSPLSNTLKPLQLSLSIASSTPSPGTQSSNEDPLTTKASPILLSQVSLKATHSGRRETTSLGSGLSSFVPAPPPMPSLLGASSAIVNSKAAPSFSSPPPSVWDASPPPVAENSFQSPPPPPPRPPPPPFFSGASPSPLVKNSLQSPPPFSSKSPTMPENSMQSLPLPPLPSSSTASLPPTVKNLFQSPCPPPPPPPPPPFSGISSPFTVKNLLPVPPPPPPPPSISSAATCSISSLPQLLTSGPPTPPPPPLGSGSVPNPSSKSSVPQPPLPPGLTSKGPLSSNSAHVAPVPPPPAPCAKGLSKVCGTALQSHLVSNGNIPSIPGPPSGASSNLKGRSISRTSPKNQAQPRKSNLKPYHWLKLTRAMQGSIWAEAQKPEESSKTPEFDMSELESLFCAAAPNSDDSVRDGKSNCHAPGRKSETVQLVIGIYLSSLNGLKPIVSFLGILMEALIELRRAYNCEIMLTKVKIPFPDLMSSVLALDDTSLDVDQVENIIKFCPTKEEMELLKGYNGDKENLGKCEQFFLELMKVPRVESKLRVFSFKIQFCSQVSDLRNSLNIVNSASEEVRNSIKLKRIMQTILSLGNALNHGTARGSAVGFRLDSLLKLTDTRARNNKMTLMHYLCKVLVEKLPELLDFPKDLVTLEASTKIQLKYLAEEMQAISKGLEKVVQELTASKNDGPVSENFCKTLKEFLNFAEGEVSSLASLYSSVGRNADALALYFGEDPARCPFEQVVTTLLNFVRMFVRAHTENCKQLELEKKKAQKGAENEKLKISSPRKESEDLIQSPIKIANIH